MAVFGALGITAWHKHPGAPSRAREDDIAFTGRLKEECETVGVALVDHSILGGAKGWCSLRKIGKLREDQGRELVYSKRSAFDSASDRRPYFRPLRGQGPAADLGLPE